MRPERTTEPFAGADDPAIAAYRDAVDAVIRFGEQQDALDVALDRCADFAVGHAYSAFIAGLLGQEGRARARGGIAKSLTRSISRRERQLVEILLLSADGNRDRAAGLASEHVLEHPADAPALAALVHWFEAKDSGTRSSGRC